MGSGFAAGAGANMLQQVLHELATRAFTQQKLDEDMRQADMQHRVQQAQLGQSQQRIGLEGERLGQDQKQFETTSGQAAQRLGMEQELQPVKIKQMQAQTEDLNRQPQEQQDTRAFREKELGLEHKNRMGEIGASGANALRVANVRGENGPVLKIQTVDADGNPITKVVPRKDAAGQDFAAQPTTDMRNRTASKGRATPVLQAISELSQKINTGQGALAKVQGGAAQLAAKANLDDDVSEYQAVVSGFTPLLARAMGHTGVLTQQDVDSVRTMLPAPTDSKSVRDRKVARIESLLGGHDAGAGAVAGAQPGGPKVGDTKQFPNGKKGVWDGHGWAAQ